MFSTSIHIFWLLDDSLTSAVHTGPLTIHLDEHTIHSVKHQGGRNRGVLFFNWYKKAAVWMEVNTGQLYKKTC